MKRVAAILVVLAWPIAAQADCSNPQTQAEINECANQDFQRADSVLNEVYAKLRARMSDQGSLDRLVDAQRAWLAYRGSSCEFETKDSIGGSIHPAELAACYREKTVARADELQRQLDCPEGDLDV